MRLWVAELPKLHKISVLGFQMIHKQFMQRINLWILPPTIQGTKRHQGTLNSAYWIEATCSCTHKGTNHTRNMTFRKVDQPLSNFQHKPENTRFWTLLLVNHKDRTQALNICLSSTHSLVGQTHPQIITFMATSSEYCTMPAIQHLKLSSTWKSGNICSTPQATSS